MVTPTILFSLTVSTEKELEEGDGGREYHQGSHQPTEQGHTGEADTMRPGQEGDEGKDKNGDEVSPVASFHRKKMGHRASILKTRGTNDVSVSGFK
jgi:hypothetical protein